MSQNGMTTETTGTNTSNIVDKETQTEKQDHFEVLNDKISKLEQQLAEMKENVLVNSMKDMKEQYAKSEIFWKKKLKVQKILTIKLVDHCHTLAACGEMFKNAADLTCNMEGDIVMDIDNFDLMFTLCKVAIAEFKYYAHNDLINTQQCIDGKCLGCRRACCERKITHSEQIHRNGHNHDDIDIDDDDDDDDYVDID